MIVACLDVCNYVLHAMYILLNACQVSWSLYIVIVLACLASAHIKRIVLSFGSPISSIFTWVKEESGMTNSFHVPFPSICNHAC